MRTRRRRVGRARDAIEFRLPFRRTALGRRDAAAYRADVTAALADADTGSALAVDGALPAGWGRGRSERLVEFPWVAAKLRAARPELVLDAGSTLNHAEVLDAVLPAVGALHVVTLAPEERSFPERSVSYVYADLRELPFRSGLYDVVACISTLEHVGMDVSHWSPGAPAAADPRPEALAAARELRRVTRVGGRILLTVPYGRPDDLGWLRQFDGERLHELVAVLEPSRATIAVYREMGELGWQRSTEEEAAECRSGPYWASAVACVDVTL